MKVLTTMLLRTRILLDIFFEDVIPWIKWGNSEDDSTTPSQRAQSFIFGG